MDQLERRSVIKRLLIVVFLIPNLYSLALYPYYAYEHSKWENIFMERYEEVQQRHQNQKTWCRDNGVALEHCNYTVLTGALDMAREIKSDYYAKMTSSEFYFYAVPLISTLLLLLGSWILTGRIPMPSKNFQLFKKREHRTTARSVDFAPIMAMVGIAVFIWALWSFVPEEIGISMIVGGIAMAVLVGIHELKQRIQKKDR